MEAGPRGVKLSQMVSHVQVVRQRRRQKGKGGCEHGNGLEASIQAAVSWKTCQHAVCQVDPTQVPSAVFPPFQKDDDLFSLQYSVTRLAGWDFSLHEIASSGWLVAFARWEGGVRPSVPQGRVRRGRASLVMFCIYVCLQRCGPCHGPSGQ